MNNDESKQGQDVTPEVAPETATPVEPSADEANEAEQHTDAAEASVPQE